MGQLSDPDDAMCLGTFGTLGTTCALTQVSGVLRQPPGGVPDARRALSRLGGQRGRGERDESHRVRRMEHPPTRGHLPLGHERDFRRPVPHRGLQHPRAGRGLQPQSATLSGLTARPTLPGSAGPHARFRCSTATSSPPIAPTTASASRTLGLTASSGGPSLRHPGNIPGYSANPTGWTCYTNALWSLRAH